MKIRVNRNIPAEMIKEMGTSFWQLILCYLYFFSPLNNLGLCACHSSMLINFMKAQEMIAAYLFFVFSAILCSARDGNIESSSGLSKSQLCGELGMHLELIFFPFLHTQVHRVSLSVTDRLSRQKCSTELREHGKLSVRQYSKNY